MIDRDGRLFGKINILDIMIVLVITLGVVFFFTRAEATIPGLGGGSQSTYVIKFFSPWQDGFVLEHIEIGDPVIDHVRFLDFGTITNIEIGEGVDSRPNSDGILVESRWGDRYSVEITTEVTLPTGSLDNGINIDGNRFAIGQTVTIRAGDSVLSLRISGLEPA